MLLDFTKHTQTLTLDKKQYAFEYDYAALAALQKETGKSPYDIYESVIEKNNLMLDDSIAIVCCAMLKHHTVEEILELKTKLQKHPGHWVSLKEAVITSFILPMLPPQVVRDFDKRSKKKVPMKSIKKK